MQETKSHKPKRTGLITVGVILTTITLAFSIPFLLGDGLGGLQGVERQAAKSMLQNGRQLYTGIDRIKTWHLTARVEKVYPTLPSEAGHICGGLTGPGIEGHYSVIISYRTIFGIQTGTYKVLNCSPPFTYYNNETGKVELE